MKMKGFRAEKQKSGAVYYYFETVGKDRKKLPLGSDYVTAVQKWSELATKPVAADDLPNFEQLAQRYEKDVMPNNAKSTQATQRSDMKHLREWFNNPKPARLDAIRPVHIYKMLEWKKAKPTTANRLKRMFSHMFNMARAWGYTEKENPVTGIEGFGLAKRTVYINDAVFKAVWTCANPAVRDALDLAYLTGQRPGDILALSERQIVDGVLEIPNQNKTGRPLRIRVEGEFAVVLERIAKRKASYKVWCANLTVNLFGMPLTEQVLRKGYEKARAEAAKANPTIEAEIKKFWFYDLRAKAADDKADSEGDQAASDQLGHTTVATTRRHYLRKGKLVGPTK